MSGVKNNIQNDISDFLCEDGCLLLLRDSETADCTPKTNSAGCFITGSGYDHSHSLKMECCCLHINEFHVIFFYTDFKV